jgi:hypothetical protein
MPFRSSAHKIAVEQFHDRRSPAVGLDLDDRLTLAIAPSHPPERPGQNPTFERRAVGAME